MRKQNILFGIFSVLIIVSCDGNNSHLKAPDIRADGELEVGTPTSTPTPDPTGTTVVTPLPTITVTATPLPTFTPTSVPTDVPTEIPTATPSPTFVPTEIPTEIPTETPTPTPVPTTIVLEPNPEDKVSCLNNYDPEKFTKLTIVDGGIDNFFQPEKGIFPPSKRFLRTLAYYYKNDQSYNRWFDTEVIPFDHYTASEFNLRDYRGRIVCGAVKFRAKVKNDYENTYTDHFVVYGEKYNHLHNLNCPYKKVYSVQRHSLDFEKVDGDMTTIVKIIDLSNELPFLNRLNHKGGLQLYYEDDAIIDYFRVDLLVRR